MDSKEDEEISIDAKKSKISGISENSDEEFSIDFGKITGFFKKKEKPKEEKKEEPKTEKEDEEISFNFSKIKDIFKGKESREESRISKEEDEITIDWKKTLGSIKKYQILILLLALIFFTIFVRIQSANLPITGNWARDAVTNSIKSQIKLQIWNFMGLDNFRANFL